MATCLTLPRALRAAIPAGALALALAGGAGAQGTLSALQTDVDQIARRARPSVVTVFAVRTESAPKTAVAATATAPHVRTRVGSGVAVEENLILTTASVVLQAERTLVSTANGLQAEAEIVGVDPVFNLALLRVPTLRLPPLRFAQGRPARVGDWVVSLGTSYNAQPTQSLGNVAQRHREPGQWLLQLTNTVYPGNSGAAALNIRGELAGLVHGELGSPALTGTASDGERRPWGTSFAMPVETLRPVFESLKREGRVRHGYLGVTTLAASLESDREGGPSTPIGALVDGIIGGGPADRLGLRPGDLIVAYDGERVETPEQLARWVLATPPGRTVTLVWVRRDIGYNGTVVLKESPERVPQWLAGALADPQPDGPRKIAELEREIRRLSQELGRLKDQSGPPPR
ncbi:MAG: trypsin-like peptidase domain-containing protein [Candidatus Eisenbacteria bacterium]